MGQEILFFSKQIRNNGIFFIMSPLNYMLFAYIHFIKRAEIALGGEERLEKSRQMELQLPELSYVVVSSFLLFYV